MGKCNRLHLLRERRFESGRNQVYYSEKHPKYTGVEVGKDACRVIHRTDS